MESLLGSNNFTFVWSPNLFHDAAHVTVQVTKPTSFTHSPFNSTELSPWESNSNLLIKFHAFYGTQRFITIFTAACHWSLFWASYPTYIGSIWILSSSLNLDIPSGLFPFSFPLKTLYAFLVFPISVTYSSLCIIVNVFREQMGRQKTE